MVKQQERRTFAHLLPLAISSALHLARLAVDTRLGFAYHLVVDVEGPCLDSEVRHTRRQQHSTTTQRAARDCVFQAWAVS